MKRYSQLEPIYWAPQPKLGGGWIAFKDSPSPPPAPDYTGAAKQTAASQMSTQYTPYGSQVYSSNSSSPSGYQSDITLNPEAQKALSSQLNLSGSMGDLANKYLPQVEEAYSKPMDMSSVPSVADKAYSNYTARLDPQWKQAEGSNDAQLANQGIMRGSEAYDNAKREFNAAKNDAYTSANTASINTMPQTYQLQSSIYNQPLNTLNAIRSGAQVQNPTFGATPGANYAGATQAQGQYGQGLYNAQVAQSNSGMAGLYGLGAAGLMAMSDRKTKKNIREIGEDKRGFGIYEFSYKWDKKDEPKHVGVMADEVEKIIPGAVFDIGGVKAVDYGKL